MSQISTVQSNDNMSSIVEELKIKDPKLYAKCQTQGEFIMKSMPDDDSVGKDKEGERIVVENTKQSILDYGLDISDLSKIQINLMCEAYGNDWWNTIHKSNKQDEFN